MSKGLEDIEQHVPALRRYARALTRDADRADDIVQDCLERALRKQGLFRPTGPLRAWLFKILLNVYRNDLRTRRRRAETVALDGLATEPSVLAAQPGRIALAEMARALDVLPPEQRETLLLVALEGFDYTEAASITGVPVGTVMSRLSRARSALRLLTDTTGGPRLRTVK